MIKFWGRQRKRGGYTSQQRGRFCVCSGIHIFQRAGFRFLKHYSGFHMREETINQTISAGSAGILARPILIQSNSAVNQLKLSPVMRWIFVL